MARAARSRARREKQLKDDLRVDTHIERTGEHPALPRIPRHSSWTCRVCGYKPLDRNQRFCLSCGRDYWGNPGVDPATLDKPARPQVRKGVSNPDPH